MKQCISRIIQFIIHLWRTLKEYVRKKKIIRKADTDNDGRTEIVIDLNGCPSEISKGDSHDKEEYHDR